MPTMPTYSWFALAESLGTTEGKEGMADGKDGTKEAVTAEAVPGVVSSSRVRHARLEDVVVEIVSKQVCACV